MYEENRFTTKQVYDQYGRSRTSNNKKDNISKSASLGGFEPDPVQRTSTTSYTYSQKDRKDKKDKKDKNKGSTYDEVPQVIKTGLGSRIDKPESQKVTGYQKVVEIFNDVMSGFGDFEEPTQPTFDTVKPQNVYKDKRYFAPNIYVPDTSQFGKGYEKKYFLGMELPTGSPKIPRSLKRSNVNIFGNTKDHPRLDMFGVKRSYTRNPDALMSPSPMDQFIPPYQGEEFLDGALLKARQQQIKDDVEKVLQNLIDPPEDYVIKTGDTLSEIAEERGTTVEVLQELNNIEDKDKDTIYTGDKLKVPPKLTDTQAALRRGLGSKKDYGEGVEVALNMSEVDMNDLSKYSADELIEMLRSFTNQLSSDREDTDLYNPLEDKSFTQRLLKKKEADNYNTLYSNAEVKSKDFKNVKVSDMTLRELVEFTRASNEYGKWVKPRLPKDSYAAKNNLTSTPVGKYQIVGTTLRSLIDKYDYDLDTKFDKKTQDKMFLDLAKEKLGGSKTMDQKVKGMRNLWEGFQSKYGTSYDDVVKVIEEIEESM